MTPREAAAPVPAGLPAARQGELRTDVDPVTDIVRVFGRGMWPEPYARAHFEELRRTLQLLRTRHPCVRVLVDLRQGAVQTPETARYVAAATSTIYKRCDRVAIVVSLSLVKLQMRRSTDRVSREMFASYAAAEAWLSAIT